MAELCKHVVKYSPWTECGEPATRSRPHPWKENVTAHYCAEHDPVRREQTALNQKERKVMKKTRWKAAEQQRKR
jgi:hypothetical protein